MATRAQTLEALLRLLKEGNAEERAVVLRLIEPHELEAIPEVIAALNDADDHVQVAACRALVGMAKQRRDRSLADAVPALVERFERGSQYVAGFAAWALEELGPLAEGAVPSLTAAVTDSASVVLRRRVARALGSIGAAAVPAAETLQAVRDDRSEDHELRNEAELALLRITQASS